MFSLGCGRSWPFFSPEEPTLGTCPEPGQKSLVADVTLLPTDSISSATVEGHRHPKGW